MGAAKKIINIGMLGCGIVGTQVATLLHLNNEELSTRAGAELVLKKIAVRNINTLREGIHSSMTQTLISLSK